MEHVKNDDSINDDNDCQLIKLNDDKHTHAIAS